MNYTALLIEFMEEKAKVLEKLGHDKEKYFNAEDAKSLRRWSNERSQQVYNSMKRKVFDESNCFMHTYPCGLGPSTCPFCIDIAQRMSCSCSAKCVYAKHHGKCTQRPSYYTAMLDINSNAIYRKLSNKWYRKLLNKLEEKHLKGEL